MSASCRPVRWSRRWSSGGGVERADGIPPFRDGRADPDADLDIRAAAHAHRPSLVASFAQDRRGAEEDEQRLHRALAESAYRARGSRRSQT